MSVHDLEADLELRDERTEEDPVRQPPNAERTASGLAIQIALAREFQVNYNNEGAHALVPAHVEGCTCMSMLE